MLTSRVQRVAIYGDVEPKLAAEVAQNMTPRVVWLNAAGCDYADWLRSKKKALDTRLQSRRPIDKDRMCEHYTDIAHIALDQGIGENMFWDRSPFDGTTRLAELSLSMDSDALSTSWQLAVYVTCLDCFMTAANLTSDIDDSEDATALAWVANPASLLLYPAPCNVYPSRLQDAVPSDLQALVRHVAARSEYELEVKSGRRNSGMCQEYLEEAFTFCSSDLELQKNLHIIRQYVSQVRDSLSARYLA